MNEKISDGVAVRPCAAFTSRGCICANNARSGERFCGVHLRVAERRWLQTVPLVYRLTAYSADRLGVSR